MNKIFTFSIIAVVMILLFGSLAASAQSKIVAHPSNYYGKEIKKIIDYLRSINMSASADNIELYLNNGKLIIDPDLSGTPTFGENKGRGGPVFINPDAFNPEKRGGWKLPRDIQWMMNLASTLVHEKYHSENHDAWDRVAGNGFHWIHLINSFGEMGANLVEVPAWKAGINFLDDIINKLLKKADDPSINKTEKKDILSTIMKLIDRKLGKIGDFEKNKYASCHPWDEKKLKKLKEDLKKKRDELTKSAKTSLKSIQDGHDIFEAEVQKKLEVCLQGSEEIIEAESQDYAIKMIEIVTTVEEVTGDSITVYLILDLDTDSDLGKGPAEFLIKHSDYVAEAEIIEIKGGQPPVADYILKISQTNVVEIYSDVNPSEKTKELFNQGAVEVTKQTTHELDSKLTVNLYPGWNMIFGKGIFKENFDTRWKKGEHGKAWALAIPYTLRDILLGIPTYLFYKGPKDTYHLLNIGSVESNAGLAVLKWASFPVTYVIQLGKRTVEKTIESPRQMSFNLGVAGGTGWAIGSSGSDSGDNDPVPEGGGGD